MIGKLGRAEGHGTTETGALSKVGLTTNVTVMDNAWCAGKLRELFGKHLINKQKLKNTLSKGLNDQLLCTQGTLVNSSLIIGKEVYQVSSAKVRFFVLN